MGYSLQQSGRQDTQSSGTAKLANDASASGYHNAIINYVLAGEGELSASTAASSGLKANWLVVAAAFAASLLLLKLMRGHK